MSSSSSSMTSSPSLNRRYAANVSGGGGGQSSDPNRPPNNSSLGNALNRPVSNNGKINDRRFAGFSASPSSMSGRSTNIAWDNYDDSSDPRWKTLMCQYFVDDDNANHDDMLFFVRHPPYKNNGAAGLKLPGVADGQDQVVGGNSKAFTEGSDSVVGDEKGNNKQQTNVASSKAQDAVFVLRKQPAPNKLPPLPCPIMWKETFFLNLIVQMPCKLTVAVCRRRTRNGQTISVARKQINKRVYALPNRSYVDGPKDNVGPPECSWPMIYYFIDDYEDMFEDVIIKKGDYLCVELSTRMPSNIAGAMSPSSMMSPPVSTKLTDRLDLLDEKRGLWTDRPSAPSSNGAGLSGRLSTNNNTNSGMLNSAKSRLGSSGSAVSGTSKVILFQGATSYSALLETYFQRIKSKNVLHRLRKPAYPTEYVMMRAPIGNGYSQVAITGIQVQEGSTRPANVVKGSGPRRISDPSNALTNQPSLSTIAERPNSAMPSRSGNTDINETDSGSNAGTGEELPISPRLNQATSSPVLSSWFKKLSLQSIAGNISQATSPPPPPKAIRCCMTFVTIPWTSIIHELYAFKDVQMSNASN
ncbi:hypothetical protein H4219_004821 [Mycoemilia scoparia]|uniref:Uncharacterized protein n=1 Tax=Mycoemilia scoparia TaxID=417184 RepID=A0A9W8DQI2_9FUNG|nr:hypothetical protein H4219_004821 [Mycoemilia scoparia]